MVENIYPEELETLVNKIEGIKESFVYGKPEDDGDYKICAKIVYDKDIVKEIYKTDDENELKRNHLERNKENKQNNASI